VAAHALARYSGVLRRSHAFRMLFAATLGSGIGTWLALLALAFDILHRTGSPIWVSALMLADFLPTIVIGLMLGPLVDRLSRRWLMLGADLSRCAIFAALPFVSSPWAIVALAGGAGFATGFFRPAVYAGLPNLVAEPELPNANAVLQTIENATMMIAPAVGGALVGAWGPHLAYWINAGTFLVSAYFVRRIPGRLLQLAPAPSHGHVRDLVRGFALVRDSRPLLTVLVAWNILMLATGFINVAEPSLAVRSFDAGAQGLGLLMGASGLGLVVGSLAAPRLLETRPVALIYLGALGLMGSATAAAALSGALAPAAALVVLSGVGNGVMIPVNSLLVQRGTPDELRGRAFTVIMSSNYAVLGLAMLASGFVTKALGARWTWGFAGCAAIVAGIVGSLLARPLELRPPRGPELVTAEEPLAMAAPPQL
jgi:MFS family permease